MYRVIDAVMVRTAAQSLSGERCPVPRLDTVSEQSAAPESSAAGVQAAASAREWLRLTWQEPLASAIELAAPDLADRIHTVLGDNRPAPPREMRRLVRSVQRYAVRARGRATPFGLFAGVGVARFGAGAVYRSRPWRAAARVDGEWLHAIIDSLERFPGLHPHLSVVAHDTVFERDDRLVLPYPTRTARSDRGDAEVSVRLTAPVAIVMRAATAQPLPVLDALSLVAAEFPATGEDVIRTLLDSLIGQGFLTTNLRPPHTTTDPLGYLLAALPPDPAAVLPAEAAARISALRALRRELRQHDDSGAVEQRQLRQRLRPAMAALDAGAHTRRLSVDLHSGTHVVLPEQIARDVETAAMALTRVTAYPFGSLSWQDYHARFLERYGIGATVSVGDLVFADTGLGFPAGFRGSRIPPLQEPALSDRDARLLELAQRAAWEHRREVVLDEQLITELSVATAETVAPHAELSVQILATSVAALDRGDYRLVLVGASRAAGTTSGRFLDLLPAADRDRMIAAYQGISTVHDGAVPVQLSAPSLAPRADNIARSPAVLPSVLRVGEHAPPSVSLDDLAVTADARHLHLVSLSRDCPVEPTTFSAVEYRRAAHPLTRFLCEISTSRTAPCAPFTWGAAAAALPYLPRVRYRRTILAPARWSVPGAELPDNAAPFTRWCAEFTRWRRRAEVPSTVTVGGHDRRMRLCLDEQADLRLLRDSLRHERRVQLREAPDDAEYQWCGRVHEVVIPLTATAPPSTADQRRRRARPAALPSPHPPGDATWCYLKLYAHPDRHDLLVRTHLPRLLDAAGPSRPWWFLRYEDPEPHLRVRIRLTDQTCLSTLVAHIADWSSDMHRRGLVSATQMNTYRPETGRFGVGAAMRAAEEVFVADSAAAATQLAVSQLAVVHPHAVIAASLVDLAAGFTGSSHTAARWLLDHVSRSTGPLDRRARADTLRITDPHHAVEPAPDLGVLADPWSSRRRALAAYRATLDIDTGPRPDDVLTDLLHLHCVRMTGLSLPTERTCTHLARAAALSWVNRTRPTS